MRAGRPGRIEGRLLSRYGRTTPARLGLAAVVKAVAVLVRRHPRAALDAAAAGLVHAGRVGVHDLTERLRGPEKTGEEPPRPRPLSKTELRRFVRLLDRPPPADTAPNPPAPTASSASNPGVSTPASATAIGTMA